jgi:hypothetical protein
MVAAGEGPAARTTGTGSWLSLFGVVKNAAQTRALGPRAFYGQCYL